MNQQVFNISCPLWTGFAISWDSLQQSGHTPADMLIQQSGGVSGVGPVWQLLLLDPTATFLLEDLLGWNSAGSTAMPALLPGLISEHAQRVALRDQADHFQ